MSYKLLVRKLEIGEKRFITREDLKSYAKALGMNYNSIISYLLSNKHILRILRGIFYIPTIEEKKLNKINIHHLDAIKAALRIKKVEKWYFGLETALTLNKMAHEYFTTEFVISNKIYRAKPFFVLGHKVRFIKTKEKMFSFGIINNCSDHEKTVLDIIYFSKYNNLSDSEIKNKIIEFTSYCSRKKLLEYSLYYPNSVKKIVKALI